LNFRSKEYGVNQPKTFIVVPCYNEGLRLPIAAFRRFLSFSSIDFVFVDDGSRDNTVELIEGLRQDNQQRMTVLRCPKNLGKAEAVRLGSKGEGHSAKSRAPEGPKVRRRTLREKHRRTVPFFSAKGWTADTDSKT
jgi:hypothetical protein